MSPVVFIRNLPIFSPGIYSRSLPSASHFTHKKTHLLRGVWTSAKWLLWRTMRRRQRSTAAILVTRQATFLWKPVWSRHVFFGALLWILTCILKLKTRVTLHFHWTFSHTSGKRNFKSFHQHKILPTSIHVRIHFVRLRKYVSKKTPGSKGSLYYETNPNKVLL